MKPEEKRSFSGTDQWLSRKRSRIETVIDQLRHFSQIEHTRHRAASEFLWNLAAALIVYCHQAQKPAITCTIKLSHKDLITAAKTEHKLD